ncbi:hypothetical protein J6X09_00955 [Candidatus Saccharibacteria bacterium]|nr:hypothetical protein [Candidatus Saccharibacteria bacterium]
MKKKGALVAIGGIVVAAGIGVTWAVTHDLSVINNDLALANYQTTFTEEFTSPPNWQTCQTVPKTITATNNSNVPIAVRVKLEGTWTAADGVTELPNVSSASGLTMAVINYANSSDWTQEGEYYVYNTELAPNATTTSFLSGVTLNCEANLDERADGAYAGAEYHLKATIQTIQANAKSRWYLLYDAIAARENDLGDYQVNFWARSSKYGTSPETINGNGVNAYTEDGAKIYYFRGMIDDNYVIWGNHCWRILRTTKTGGVKLYYYGSPTYEDGVGKCLAAPTDDSVSIKPVPFNDHLESPADVGYMFGERIEGVVYKPTDSETFIFSNDVSRNGDTYTLDTSEGQSISGTWESQLETAATKYHYFCLNGQVACDNTQIGYIIDYSPYYRIAQFTYLPVGGYDDIEAMKTAMFANEHDSRIKTEIETWLEEENLDGHVEGTRNYEDDLEDAVYCNDRRYMRGALAGKDASGSSGIHMPLSSSWGIGMPLILECPSLRDAFTKEIANGNGKLKHKIGLVTASELQLAGLVEGTAFVWSLSGGFTMSPAMYEGSGYATVITMNTYVGYRKGVIYEGGLRPVVSLRSGITYVAGGDGTANNPYVIE